MKNKILSILVFSFLLSLFAMSASADTSGMYKYTVSNEEATIKGLTCATNSFSGEQIIPNTLGEHPVTCIDEYAFKDCYNLTRITIPESVTSIGYGAFYNCKGLKSVSIPDSVTSIGNKAFYNCSCLTSITIPDSVTNIGNSAFSYCSNLKTVYKPVSSKWSYSFGSGVKVIYTCKVNFVGDYEESQTVIQGENANFPTPPSGYRCIFIANGKVWSNEAITDDITIKVMKLSTSDSANAEIVPIDDLYKSNGQINYNLFVESTSDISGVLMMAVYDESGKLIKIHTIGTLTNESEKIISGSTASGSDEYSYKIFLWSSLNSTRPLAKSLCGVIEN